MVIGGISVSFGNCRGSMVEGVAALAVAAGASAASVGCNSGEVDSCGGELEFDLVLSFLPKPNLFFQLVEPDSTSSFVPDPLDGLNFADNMILFPWQTKQYRGGSK